MPVHYGAAPVPSDQARCASCGIPVWISVRGRGSIYRIECMACAFSAMHEAGETVEIRPAPWVADDL
jgi:hypothetical protein